MPALRRTGTCALTIPLSRSHSQGKTCLRDLGAIDLHTHVYLPRYMAMLRARHEVPFVRNERLVILPDEQKQLDDAASDASIRTGRPIGAEYWDVREKLAYMDHHGIATSALSLANPWLDFLPLSEQVTMATLLNDDIDALCADSSGRLVAFGVTPQSLDEAVAELHHIATLEHVHGIILGTSGFGKGLDDPDMLAFYQTVCIPVYRYHFVECRASED